MFSEIAWALTNRKWISLFARVLTRISLFCIVSMPGGPARASEIARLVSLFLSQGGAHYSHRYYITSEFRMYIVSMLQRIKIELSLSSPDGALNSPSVVAMRQDGNS